jgi:hypothetical protein
MQSSPASHHFLPLGSKYFPQNGASLQPNMHTRRRRCICGREFKQSQVSDEALYLYCGYKLALLIVYSSAFHRLQLNEPK